MSALAALCGLLLAAGLMLVADGARVRARKESGPRVVHRLDRTRLARCLGLGMAGLVVTRWPVAALGLGTLGWCWTGLFGGRRDREAAIARTEAVASWTEMLRDTIAGAHGLEEAVITSAAVAPVAIRPEITALAVRLERDPLDVALGELGRDLAHPTADLVVTALVLASRGAVGDLRDLLSTLATATREEAAMHLRVEATRARLRTAVKVIVAVTGAMAVGLVVLNRSYLDVYGSLTGQLVLGVVVATWAIGLWLLARMGRFVTPDRFLAASHQGSDL